MAEPCLSPIQPSFTRMQGNTDGTKEKCTIKVGLIRGFPRMSLGSMGPPNKVNDRVYLHTHLRKHLQTSTREGSGSDGSAVQVWCGQTHLGTYGPSTTSDSCIPMPGSNQIRRNGWRCIQKGFDRTPMVQPNWPYNQPPLHSPTSTPLLNRLSQAINLAQEKTRK